MLNLEQKRTLKSSQNVQITIQSAQNPLAVAWTYCHPNPNIQRTMEYRLMIIPHAVGMACSVLLP